MYAPELFAVDDPERLAAVIEAYPFATVLAHPDAAPAPDASGAPVTTPGAPTIAHVPLRVDDARRTLVGHVARKNPFAARVQARARATAVFVGPHAYVSPSFYTAPEEQVPTWNYVAVHAEGRLAPIDEPAVVLATLAELARAQEGEGAEAWRPDRLDPTFLNGLARAITVFRLEIERLEGTFKMSQNRAPEDRAGVVRGLSRRGGTFDRDVAAMVWAEEGS
jgi:transcriptional regulator